MNNNLPEKKRDGILQRVFNLFKKFFYKGEKIQESILQENEEENITNVDETVIMNIETVKKLRDKFSELEAKLAEEKEKNDGKIPLKKQFLASITDFAIIEKMHRLTDEELLSSYGIEGIEHLITTIEDYSRPEDEEDKFDFSLKVNMQISNLLQGKDGNYDELLQTLYMTIFQRYNDDIKKENNYKITPEFADKVYRFAGEGLHPEVKHIDTSEKDIGNVYMTYESYKKLLSIWNQEYETEQDRKINTKIEMVKNILPNIRNRMMHGDFNNKYDEQGNKIVKISPYGFKAKFFFDCIVEFYEVVAKEIEDNVKEKDLLFDFEKVLLKKENAETEIMNDKDKLMTLVLPMYVNSFITYNFKQKNDYKKLRRRFLQDHKDKPKVDFLDEYNKDGNTDSFVYRVAEYNKEKLGKEYSAYDIFSHFRNSVVHNNFKCENGMIYLQDFDEEGNETARFVIPYEMFEGLIERQSIYARQYLNVDFPGNPGENHDEITTRQEELR